jgi:WG containing repeat
MKIIKKYTILLFFTTLNIFSQNQKLEKFKKDYDFKQSKSGFTLLQDKDSREIKIANINGDIIYSNNNRPAFFSGLKCDKFFTGKPLLSGNDGGGNTIEEFEDIELHDLSDPKVGIKLNFNFADGSRRQLFEVYQIFDRNNKIGLINSCGKVIIQPKYNHIANFNNLGLAVAYTDSEYTVIDTLGNPILKQGFKHGLSNFYKYNNESYDDIKDNRIIGSNDGKLFGIYDFKEDKQLIPFVYDDISVIENKSYQVNEGEMVNYFYLARKNEVESIIDYSNFNEILPLSLQANGYSSILKINGKYFIDFYKTKKIIRQINSSTSIDESKFFHNIYYDGKTLFDPKLEIKNIEIFKNRFITLQLHNGGSMVYDLEKSKFVSNFPNDLVKINGVNFTISISKNEGNLIKGIEEYFQVSFLCGDKCTRNALFNLDGKAKTTPLQEGSFSIIEVDKAKDIFFYLVQHRVNNFELNYNYSLFNNDGKLILDNFNMYDSKLDYAYFVKNNQLVLNEEIKGIENSHLYGKTAFDINGNMVGERYKHISEPSRVQEVKSNFSKAEIESQKNNRFLKK